MHGVKEKRKVNYGTGTRGQTHEPLDEKEQLIMAQERRTPGLFSVPDSSRELGGISQSKLWKHIAQGTVRDVVRLGRKVFLRGEELERIRREGLPSLRSKSSNGQGKEQEASDSQLG